MRRLSVWKATAFDRLRMVDPVFDAWRTPLHSHPGWEKVYFSVANTNTSAFQITSIAVLENSQARLLDPNTAMVRDEDGFRVLPDLLPQTLGKSKIDLHLDMRTVPIDSAGDILVGSKSGDIIACNLPTGDFWLEFTWHWKGRRFAPKRTIFKVEDDITE